MHLFKLIEKSRDIPRSSQITPTDYALVPRPNAKPAIPGSLNVFIQLPKTPYICLGVSLLLAVVAVGSQLSQNLASTRLQRERNQTMETIAKHVLSNTCRKVKSEDMLIGNVISLPNDGKSPTSCIESPNQYAHASYYNNEFTINQVFSVEEIEAVKSQIKESR